MNQEKTVLKIKEYLDSDDLFYEYHEDDKTFLLRMEIEDCMLQTLEDIRIIVWEETVGVAVQLPFAIQDENKYDVGDLLNRFNFDLNLGNFLISSKSIVAKVELDCTFRELSQVALRQALFVVIALIQDYTKPLMQVLSGAKSAEAAYQLWEKESG